MIQGKLENVAVQLTSPVTVIVPSSQSEFPRQPSYLALPVGIAVRVTSVP